MIEAKHFTLVPDLQALMQEIDTGWASPRVKTGIGGCLFVAMNRMIDKSGNGSRTPRLHDMIVALGFHKGHSPSLPDLWHWNDAQVDVNVVKERVERCLQRFVR